MKSIQLNGRDIELPEAVETIHDLLQLYELENRIVVVEVNKEIVFKEQYTKKLVDRDTVEIVHFVGGG